MKVSSFLMLLLASLTLFFTACTEDTKDPVVKDKCEGNTCASEGKVCDPGSGECVEVLACDPVCVAPETCNEVTGKCESNVVDLCNPNPCQDGQVCVPADGSCKDFNIEDIDTIVEARMYSSTYGDQNGIILTHPLEGVVVAIRGIATSSKHAVVIRQADSNEYAGIYVNFDGIKAETDFKVLAIGNLVSIKGKVVEYFDRTELQPQTTADVTIVSASATLPTPVNVSSVDFQEKYESMVLSLTNVPFTVTQAISITSCSAESPCASGAECVNSQCADNIYDTTLTDANGKTVKVSSSFAYPRVELTMGQTVTKVAGVMTYDYGEFKMYPRDASDVGAVVVTCDPACEAGFSCVDGTCVATTPENTEEACNDGISNDGDAYIDCDDHDCNNTVVCGGTPDKCAEVTCENAGEVCDPADGVCKAVETKTIGEIRTAEAGMSNDGFVDGGSYNTSGTVTAILATGSNMGFYMQDATGGIMVYTKAVVPTVTLGDTVSVTGQVGNYYGLLRFLDDAVIGTPTSGTVPAVTELAATNLVEANESMLVKITGGPFTVISTDTHANSTVRDASGNEFVILDTLFGYTAPMDGAVYSNLQGILTFDYGAYKLMPRNADDMASVTFDCSANPCNDNFEYCSADDTCSLIPGKCGANTDCEATEECNMTTYVCETPAPVCSTPCADYETCTATDTCTLNAGRCNDVSDCNDGATSCDANVCVGGTAPQFANNDFSVWTDDATPTDWRIGNSGFVLSKVTVSGSDFALGILGTNASSNAYVITTPATTATTSVPTSFTFDLNGSGKISVNVACDNAGTITKKTYNLNADTDIATRTELTVSGSNAYVEFNTSGAWKTFTIVAAELSEVWVEGSSCSIEFKEGKAFEFNASLDNVMINY